MIACRDALPTASARWTPKLVLSILVFINACSVAPGGGGEPRVPTVDASVLGLAFDVPAVMDEPAPVSAPALIDPEPTPMPAAAPIPDNLVMATTAYVPNVALPLPEPAHSRRLEADWLAPLAVSEANTMALRERLMEALRGAGFDGRWRLQPLAGGDGFLLVSAVEQVGGGGRWAARGAGSPGRRYRSFVFQVGEGGGGIPGRVMIYEADAPHAELAGFQAGPTLTAVDHLKQAGILQAREVLVLATAP